MKSSVYIVIAAGIILLVGSSFSVEVQETKWTAPTSADSLINPLKNNSTAMTEGKKTYEKYCWQCHGLDGKGGGPGSKNLNPKPADHTSTIVQGQSDGAIFWKITKGRGAMQPYERILNKTQRWQLVEYIRSLAPAK